MEDSKRSLTFFVNLGSKPVMSSITDEGLITACKLHNLLS